MESDKKNEIVSAGEEATEVTVSPQQPVSTWRPQDADREVIKANIRRRVWTSNASPKAQFIPAKPLPTVQDDGQKTVAVYARVSTKSTEQVSSIENQTRYYTEKVEKTPNWEMLEIYSDEGISGVSISMLNKPAVTFKHRQMTFNAASVRLFEGVRYILPFTSKSKKRVAVVTCKEEESESVEWARRNKKGVWVSKTITSDEYVSKIFKFMGWDQTCRYKVMGRVSNSERGLILVFDLAEAILFTTPEEYVDKKTGEVKKRQIKYFPDEYRERIGKTYKDYIEKYQMSFFEQLSDYSEEDSAESAQAVATESTTEY